MFFIFLFVILVFDVFLEVFKYSLFLDWFFLEKMRSDFDLWGEVICMFLEYLSKYFINEVVFFLYGSLVDMGNLGILVGFFEKFSGLWKSKWATVRFIGFVWVFVLGIFVNLLK